MLDQTELHLLIPKDKFDLSSIDRLMQISEQEVNPILPALLCWISDMNWPVASAIVKVLLRFPQSMVPLLKAALLPESTEVMLKYWIIVSLLPLFSFETQLALREDIIRIIEHPSEGEKKENVDQVAFVLRKQYGNRYNQDQENG